jgi:hypothetical protein
MGESFPGGLVQQRQCANRLSAIGHRQESSLQTSESDPDFAAAFDAAVEEAVEELEQIARDRAKKSSDLLLIFLLKAHRPEKYRESRVSIPPAELNKLIEVELRKLREAEETPARVN